MNEIDPKGNNGQIAQGGAPSTLPAESKTQNHESISNGGRTDQTSQRPSPPIKPWKIKETAVRWWNFIKSPDFTNPAIAIATIAIAIATVFTWVEVHSGGKQTDKIVTASQSIKTALETSNTQSQEALNKSFDHADDALKKTLKQGQDAMDGSNKQSKIALDAAIQQSQLDQRAWIVWRGIGPVPQLDQPWEPQVHFTNTGRTPAKNVLLSCNLVPLDKEARFPKEVAPDSPTILAPNDDQFCILKPMTIPKVNQTFLDEVSTAIFRVYIYGSADYFDVFGKEHWLTFCRVMQPDGKTWSSCKTGNDTGDGKKPEKPIN
jgi:hypothetical protein